MNEDRGQMLLQSCILWFEELQEEDEVPEWVKLSGAALATDIVRYLNEKEEAAV